MYVCVNESLDDFEECYCCLHSFMMQLFQFVKICVRCVVLDKIEIPSAFFGKKGRLL